MRLRIKFTKMPPLTYIGHLDLMRYFQKVLRRANIPVKYSEGYSPHMEMSFALPLGVGTRSIGDYLDVELNNDEVKWLEEQYLSDKEKVKYEFDENKMCLELLQDIGKNINKQSVEEAYIKGLNIVPNNKKNKVMTLVSYADYIISIPYETTDIFERDDFLTNLEKFLEGDIVIEKKTKSGIKPVDLTESLIEYRLAMTDKIVNKEIEDEFNYFKFMDNEQPYKVFKDDFVSKTIDEFYENEIASEESGNLILFVRTKAGSVGNLNPSLLVEQFYKELNKEMPIIHTYRLEMYDKNGKRLLESIIE